MTEQNINNTLSEGNANTFWLTRPPPVLTPSHFMTPMNNLDYRRPLAHANMSSCDKVTQMNPMELPYGCNVVSNLNYQGQYVPFNQSITNLFPPLPDNIDEEYIFKYLCPLQKPPKDATSVWIESWLANKEKVIPITKVKSTNVKINKISDKVKECKILLENMNSNKEFLNQNISTMTENEWKMACSNLFSIKKQLDTIINTLNLDNNSMSELKLKLAKRKKKRDRLKRVKSNLKIIKSEKKDEIREINRKIDIWQNTIKQNILKEKRLNEIKIEANIFLKGVRGKIDSAKNQLSLFDNLEKLRKIRLHNCVNKRKNPFLEESLSKLKILWQQKLTDYNKEEEELKNMLFKAVAEKHEIEIQENLAVWDQILFGPDFRSHEVIFNSLHTFIEIRRDWDKFVINENEMQASSSSIPVGWIIPSVPCNSDWAKYSNSLN